VHRSRRGARTPVTDGPTERLPVVEPLPEHLANVPAHRAISAEACAPSVDADEEDEDWIEPFSLLENVVAEKFRAPVRSDIGVVAEVIHYVDGEVRDVRLAARGVDLCVGADDFPLLRQDRDGLAVLRYRAGFSGTVVIHGKPRPLAALRTDRLRVCEEEGLYAVELGERDCAQIVIGERGYLIRFVKPPALPPSRLKARLGLGTLKAAGASAAFHGLLALLLIIATPRAGLTLEPDEPSMPPKPPAIPGLVKIDLTPPKPAPPPDAPSKTTTPSPPTKPGPVKLVKVFGGLPFKRPPKHLSAHAQAAGILAVLQNAHPALSALDPGKVSNIDAIRSSGSAALKISGVIDKLGNGVSIGSGGGGGGEETKTISQLIGTGDDVGVLPPVFPPHTKKLIRGKLRVPVRDRDPEVHCDRGAIQSVINGRMSAVQSCYERALLHAPSLAGRLVLDWRIGPDGVVRWSRQVSSTLTSSVVATCVLGAIRTWQFPACGPITVRYPFIFRSRQY
jgi:hypothetical protein